MIAVNTITYSFECLLVLSAVLSTVEGGTAIQLPKEYPGKGCNVSNITVQENFDIAKYTGAWYEVGWLPLYFEAQYTPYIDYVEVYKQTSGTDNIEADTYGRALSTDDECAESNKILYYRKPAKYYYPAKNGNVSIDVDYWVLSTDYLHYSLCYGCTARSGDTCLAATAWIWSRTLTLDLQYYAIINSTLPGVCLQPGELINTAQEKECRDITSRSDINTPFYSWQLITIILMVLVNSVIT